MLDSDDYARLGAVIKVNPPVREPHHKEAIWRALLDGTIGLISTDHAPHAPEEKTRSIIWQTDAGFPGVETQMPLMLTAVNQGKLSLEHYVRVSSENPAKAFGLYPMKGAISIGSHADLAIVDLALEQTIDQAKLHSVRSRITPFHGKHINGLPIHTILRGQYVMKNRTLVAESFGIGRSVHTIQRMPVPDPRHAHQSLAAVVR
jgi:dihydroorotase